MHSAVSRTSILFAGVALSALLVNASANAGGFANRQQSVSGQGASYAGVAAGGAPSSMFWNPATMTQFSRRDHGNGRVVHSAEVEAERSAARSTRLGFTRGQSKTRARLR